MRGVAHRRWVVIGTIALASALVASPAGADVDSVQSQAAGVAVTGFLGSIGPVPTVSVVADEASAPAELGPFTATSGGVTLPSFPSLFSTGTLVVATSGGGVAGENHAGFAEARALAQDVNVGPGVATATLIGASCLANGDGSIGSTVIQGGVLNGVPFGNNPEPTPWWTCPASAR